MDTGEKIEHEIQCSQKQLFRQSCHNVEIPECQWENVIGSILKMSIYKLH